MTSNISHITDAARLDLHRRVLSTQAEQANILVEQAKAIESLTSALNRAMSNQNNLNRRMALLEASCDVHAEEIERVT